MRGQCWFLWLCAWLSPKYCSWPALSGNLTPSHKPLTIRISNLILIVQGASLIKGKIFHTGSLDSSVNDVDVTKRFNIGKRKERACKVRHHLQLTLEGQYLVILIWVQKVRRDIIYPQKGRNSQGSYLFIVNQDTFRQAVEVKHHLYLLFIVVVLHVPSLQRKVEEWLLSLLSIIVHNVRWSNDCYHCYLSLLTM